MSAITWDSQAGLAGLPLKRLRDVPWGVRRFHSCGMCSWSTGMEMEVNLHGLPSASVVTRLNTEQLTSFILSMVNRFPSLEHNCSQHVLVPALQWSEPATRRHEPPPILSPTPLGHHRAELSPLHYTAAPHWLSAYISATVSVCPTLPFLSQCVRESLLYICASVPALQTGSSMPFSWVLHTRCMCVAGTNTQHHFLFLTYLTLCDRP